MSKISKSQERNILCINKMRKQLVIISHNINGRFYEKIACINDLADKHEVDFFFIQEVHLIQAKFNTKYIPLKNYTYVESLLTKKSAQEKYFKNKKRKIKRKYRNNPDKAKDLIKMINKNNFRPSEGVITLINKRWCGKYRVIKHEKKRFILIILELKDERFFLLNLYAPTGKSLKQKDKANHFLENIIKVLKTNIIHSKQLDGEKITHLVIAGDFNMVQKANLDRDKNLSQSFQINIQNKILKKIAKELKVIDIYRFLNRDKRKYTFRRLSCLKPDNKDNCETNGSNLLRKQIYLSRARIDFFLTKRNMLANIAKCDIIGKCTYNSDHSPIILEYKIKKMGDAMPQYKSSKMVFNPKIRTKELGIIKLKELGENFIYNKKVHESYNRWKEQDNITSKIRLRDETFQDITKNIFEYFEVKVGLTKPRKNNISWSDKAVNNPKAKFMRKARKKCDRILKAINDYYVLKLNTNTKVKKVIKIQNRIYGIQKYWDKFITDRKLILTWRNNDNQRNAELIEQIKQLRNTVVRILRTYMKLQRVEKFSKCANSYIENYVTQPKKFYSKILPKNENYTNMEILQNPDNKNEISNCSIKKLKWIHTYFNEKVYKSKIILEETPVWLRDKKKAKIGKDKVMCMISEKELQDAIIHLRNFTAPGEDNIPPELYEAIWQNNKTRTVLIECYNNCLETKTIPQNWKMANIFLIPKKKNPIDLDNYRPISLLNAQYKIFTQILTVRLSKFLEQNNFISELQQGSRKKCSTLNHINSLINIYRDRKESNKNGHAKNICVTYLDIKKAFDSIETSVIDKTLEFYDVPIQFRKMLLGIYRDNKAKVITPFGVTETINIQRGVRQGDVLSPLLFIMVINPLIDMIKEENMGYKMTAVDGQKLQCAVLAYVDDMVFLTDNRKQMIRLLKIVKKILNTYGIQINYKKTKYSSTYKKDKDIQIDNEVIKYITQATCYRYLGILINLNLNWQRDQKKAVQNFLYKLNRIKFQLYSPDIKVEIINNILMPALVYHMNFYIFSACQKKIIKKNIISMVRLWYNIPRNIKNEFIWLNREYAGIGITNVNALNYAVFMENIKKNTLNTENYFSKSSTLILIKNDLLLRNNNHHLLNIKFQQNVDKQKFSILDSTLKAFKKIIYKFNLSIGQNILFRNRLEYFLPVRIYNRVKKPITKKFGSTDCTTFANKYRMLKVEVSRELSAYQKKMLYPLILCENTHIMKPNIGLIISLEKEIYQIPKVYKIISNANSTYIIQKNCGYVLLEHNVKFINNEIWAWSDGSGDNIKFGWGAWFAQNSILNNKGRTYLINSVFEGEMMAIEYIISVLPLDINIRIFIDCQSAIDVIREKVSTSKQDIINTKLNKYIIKRIKMKMKQRTASTYLTKIRSHYKYKLRVSINNDMDLYKKINKEIRDLKNKFGSHFKLVIQGNDEADNLAKESLKSNYKIFQKCAGMDTYTIFCPLKDAEGKNMQMLQSDVGNPIVMSIRKYILNIYQEKYKKKWEKSRSKRWNNIHVQYEPTMNILKTKFIDLNLFFLKKFFIRIINNSLSTPHDMYIYAEKLREKKSQGAKLYKRQLYKTQVYTTNKCSMCSKKEDIFHMTTVCTYNKVFQKSKIQDIQKICDANSCTKKIQINKWLTMQKYNNIPLNKRKALKRNIKLLNTGMITADFAHEIQSKFSDKKDANKILSNIQWIIIGYAWLMYKNSLQKYFINLKNHKKYVSKYHQRKKNGVT